MGKEVGQVHFSHFLHAIRTDLGRPMSEPSSCIFLITPGSRMPPVLRVVRKLVAGLRVPDLLAPFGARGVEAGWVSTAIDPEVSR